ncbi:MAG: trypsin-like peptidase domain-containing protein [Elusimicrobia bacterium]|nr:trypsin-like peptidase domain-containing protein [Elusimicrobiota bacterium]
MRKPIMLAVLLSLPVAALAQVDNDTIYGSDDRVDLYQVKEDKVLSLADSTVALFDASRVSVNGPTATLGTSHYGKSMGLCPEEKFWDQHNGAFCSGFLVAPDVIASAGHCVTSDDGCKGVKFVFGFALKKEGDVPDAVPAGEVYSCSKLLGRLQDGGGADWSLTQLDRPVAGHKPLSLSKTAIANGDPVFVIGHPAGLPTKVAGGAKVRDASPEGYFRANTDTFGGNSGSAVFNGKTGLVEGILVRGEVDYEQKGDCRVSKACPDDGCRGEDVTKVSAWAGSIPPGGQSPARIAGVVDLPRIIARLKAGERFSFDSGR